MPQEAVVSRTQPLLTPATNLSAEQQRVLDLLTLEAKSVDSLVEASSLPAASIVATLTMLELRGVARRVPGNAFVRAL